MKADGGVVQSFAKGEAISHQSQNSHQLRQLSSIWQQVQHFAPLLALHQKCEKMFPSRRCNNFSDGSYGSCVIASCHRGSQSIP